MIKFFINLISTSALLALVALLSPSAKAEELGFSNDAALLSPTTELPTDVPQIQEPPTAPAPKATNPPATPPQPQAKTENRDYLFDGGSDSLVARTVGHAEGTRGADGAKTRAYEGHTDPGNGVWNLGSFSFQHCKEAQYNCSTPEQADVHQLKRLEGQAAKLRQQAEAIGYAMTELEELNGIDLANQAPAAALAADEYGYAGNLNWFAKNKPTLSEADRIVEARVWSYWNPKSKRWNAPGLGNTEANIRHDQNRRSMAIARAYENYQQQGKHKLAPEPEVAKAQPKVQPEVQIAQAPQPDPEAIVDQIIGQNLSFSSDGALMN